MSFHRKDVDMPFFCITNAKNPTFIVSLLNGE